MSHDTQNPNVIFVSDVEFFKGGAERSLFDLMANPNITPIFTAPDTGEMSDLADEKGYEFHKIDYGSVLTVHRPFKALDVFRTFMAALNAAKQLKKLAKEKRAIALHTNGLKAHGVACLARLIGGAPVVIHYRAVPFTGLEKLFWKATQIIGSQVVLVSRPCWPGESLPKNVQVVFNAINLPDPKIAQRPSADTPFILGFIGRIQFTKGVDTLIEWFEHAVQKGLDLKLQIRGEPADHELDYDQKCRQMVIDKNLSDRITFEGRVQGFDKIYGGIHANVVSSVIPDPLPRSVMEASSLGIPVLGYPAGGIPYMFEDKKSGFLIKDEHEFYEAVKALSESPDLRDKIGAAAIENAKNNFGMERLHIEITKIYQKI